MVIPMYHLTGAAGDSPLAAFGSRARALHKVGYVSQTLTAMAGQTTALLPIMEISAAGEMEDKASTLRRY